MVKKLCIIKNWMGQEGLQFMQTVKNSEKEACKTAGLYKTLNEEFSAQYNETTIL